MDSSTACAPFRCYETKKPAARKTEMNDPNLSRSPSLEPSGCFGLSFHAEHARGDVFQPGQNFSELSHLGKSTICGRLRAGRVDVLTTRRLLS